MARSFFAEAVSSTLRKPFDAWQILQGVEQQAVQGVGQPQLVQHRGGVSLVALTALRQTVAFVGSAKQAAGDKIAVAETVASMCGAYKSFVVDGVYDLWVYECI